MTVPALMFQLGEEKGLRLPKALLEESNLPDRVLIEVKGRCLVIHPAESRQGWDAAFAQMAAQGDDKLLDPEATSSWDNLEWEW